MRRSNNPVNIYYPTRPSKYLVAPAERRTYNGVLYASLAEARRAATLDMLVKCGMALSWARQPRYHLGTLLHTYVADFLVTDSDGSQHVEDVKGYPTAKFKNDLRLWREFGPLPLWIVRPSGSSWRVQIIEPKKKGTP